MRRISIRWRLTLFHAITMATIMIVLIIALFAVIGVLQDDRMRDRVRDCAWIGESSLRNHGDFDEAEVNALGCEGVRLTALNSDGRILTQLGFVADPGAQYPSDFWRPVLQSQGEFGAGAVTAESSEDEGFAFAIPVTISDPPARIIVSSMSYRQLGNEMIFIVPVVISAVAFVALIVIVIASYFLVRWSLAPVATITDAARDITESDLSRRLPVSSPGDELGRLSETINDLLGRLQVAFEQREQALTAQRRFVADASHELRTPLTSILGYTRMLRQWGLDEPETARESVGALEQEAERMHKLVASLLMLARGDEQPEMTITDIDVRDLVTEAVDRARAFADDGQELTVDIPSDPVRVAVDVEFFAQVLAVLLDNAVKYAPQRSIDVSVGVEGHAAVIRVTDHGQGIDAQHLPHIFDRFYRVEESRTTPGSGLGLSIAKQIVERHGGTIQAESTFGEGATFTVRVPSLAAAQQSQPAP